MTRKKAPARARAFGETDAVELFSRAFAARASGVVSLGIGDDAAVLRPVTEPLVWTVDASVEGTHFERAWLGLEDIGYRAFQAAASDLAAMGARPLGALSALELPKGFSKRDLAALVAGQARAARECGAPVVGGNVARSPRLALTTTLLGTARAPLRRDGARAGDELWLLGDVGLSGLGLALLRKRPRGAHRGAARVCVEAWRHPRALLAEGARLVGRASAAIDVSDGLAGDVANLSRASGVRCVVEAQAVERALAPELVEVARSLGRSPLDVALNGGEDYALLATGPSARRPRRARVIGRVERGRGAVLELPSGRTTALGPGFDHLKR
jgi:thiamine-monophosphate kinase